MREIKFRSWNKNHFCFFYFKDGKYYRSIECKPTDCISERICFEFSWDNAEQYTGLKDKNGVEIYEGDICYYSWENEQGSIKYSAGYFHICGGILGAGDIISENLEIKCNIYENPKLLGDSK